MPEKLRLEGETRETKKVLAAIFKAVLGLAFLICGVAAVIRWFDNLKIVFTGSIGLLLVMAGIITLAIAKE